MDKETIVRYNKAIATYLGYVYVPSNKEEKVRKAGWQKSSIKYHHEKTISNWYLCRSHNDLPYYRDWNRLMEAVDKLEDMGVRIKIEGFFCTIEYGNYFITHVLDTKHQSVFDAVGKFIEYLTTESITL